MIRKLNVSVVPSEALVALVALHAPSSHARSLATETFGPRFGQEVARAFEAHARTLDVFGQCVDWLERRGLAAVDRPRTRTGVRHPTWRCAVEFHVDVRDLTRALEDERDDPDSKARASAWALRMVLRALASNALYEVMASRSGSERSPVAELLAACEVAFASTGFGPNAQPPPRLAHLATRAPRATATVAEPTTSAAPPPAPKKPVDAKPADTKKSTDAKKPTDTKKSGDAKKKPFVGFGGLPEDAVPEDRRTGDKFGPRGLTLDAEFFLTEAGIETWPCDVATLERGRRLAVTKLHPDRAGEASATAFHRAVKGHAELLRKLADAPKPAPAPAAATARTAATTTTTTTAPPAPSATPPAAATASGVRPTTASAPARAPKTPRVPRTQPTTPPVPAPPPSSTGTVCEWPPRPVSVTPPPAPKPAAKPASVPASATPAKPAKAPPAPAPVPIETARKARKSSSATPPRAAGITP
jgi:hypothetical protein